MAIDEVTGSPAALGEQREAFDVPPAIAYFNTANLAPQLHAVRAAAEAALERRARPWTIVADDWFVDVERLRALFSHRRRRRGRHRARARDQLRLRCRRPQPSPAPRATHPRPPRGVSVREWLLGPFGVGYLYVAPEHREGEPLEENWIVRAGSEDFARLVDYCDEYQPGARRFDVGQRTNFELTPMAIAALEQILDWQVPAIAAAPALRTGRIAARAAELGLEPVPDAQRGPHLLGVRLPESVRARVVPALAAEGVFAAVRGDSLRIAPHLHVTDDDIGRLDHALTGAISGPHAA